MDHGSGVHRRAAGFPAGGACVHRGAPASGLAREGDAGPHARQGGLRSLAGHPRRQGLARILVAGGARRNGLVSGAVPSLRGGDGAGQRTAGHPLRAEDGRAGDRYLRQRYAEVEVPPADRPQPDSLVPGLLGAGRGLRSREPAHPCDPRRGPLRRQRDQDLDHRRAMGRHDVSASCAPIPKPSRRRGSPAC